MKKVLATLCMTAMVSASAWASENYAFKIDDSGVAFVYNSSGDRRGDGTHGTARYYGRDRHWPEQAEEVDRRLDRQSARIRAGREQGDLTRQEAARLEAEQRLMRSYLYAAMGDGRLSPREWRNLTVMLDQETGDIYRLRHNRRAAPFAAPLKSPENRWKFNRRLLP